MERDDVHGMFSLVLLSEDVFSVVAQCCSCPGTLFAPSDEQDPVQDLSYRCVTGVRSFHMCGCQARSVSMDQILTHTRSLNHKTDTQCVLCHVENVVTVAANEKLQQQLM